ncbi:MAG: hypothetical protein ACXWCG_08545 [Flavitalea sp.]
MKTPGVALICCLLCYASFAQRTRFSKKDSALFNKVEQISYSLALSDPLNVQKALPFNKVVVHDVRFDTSCIALYWQWDLLKIIRNQKLNLSGGFPSSISAYLNNSFKENLTENGSEMICYFKKFSLTGKDTLIENIRRNEAISQVRVEVECFYKTGELFFPAFKHDTTYTDRSIKIKESFSSIVREMLEPLKQKLISMDSSSVVKKKRFTGEEVLNRYVQRLNVPILTTSNYVRGVYKNWQEFKRNMPSITKFRVKTARSNAYFLIDSNNNVITPSTFFGFCDGQTIWLQRGDYGYPLYKVGNSFEFFHVVNYRYGYSFIPVRLIYRLNMDE